MEFGLPPCCDTLGIMAGFVWLQILALLGLCVLLLRLAMRGKWVPWRHPICSACGFNLYGLPETSDRCPECGGELAKVRKNAVWRRRWVSLLLAIGLVAGSLYLVFPVAYRSAFWELEYVPSGILVHFKDNRRVLDVLQSRLDAGRLSPEQERAVLESMLELSPVRIASGEIEARHDRGQLPAGIWKKYAEQALKVPIAMRTTIAKGDPLVILVEAMYARVKRLSDLSMRYRLRLKLDGREVPGNYRQQVHTVRLGIVLDSEPYVFVELPKKFTKRLSNGRHSLEATVNAEATERGRVVARRTLTEKGTITLLPEGKPSVALVSPQSFAGPVIAPRFSGKGLTIYLDGSFPEFYTPRLFRASNMGYCYRLLVRQDGRQIPLGEMAMRMSRHKWDFAWLPASPAPKVHGDRVDVVFRPDAKLGTKTIWIRRVVNKEFVIKGAIVKKCKEPQEQH